MSCSTMSVSPEHRLSAKSVGGSSLPLERSPATTGVSGLEQEVVNLSLLVETNKPDGAAATTQAKLDAGSGEGRGLPRTPTHDGYQPWCDWSHWSETNYLSRFLPVDGRLSDLLFEKSEDLVSIHLFGAELDLDGQTVLS